MCKVYKEILHKELNAKHAPNHLVTPPFPFYPTFSRVD